MATQTASSELKVDARSAVRDLLQALGEDPRREGLRRTPERVMGLMGFLTTGTTQTAAEALEGGVFQADSRNLVFARDLDFSSLCERHLLPFRGRIDVAYLPGELVIEPSRWPRLVEVFARRLQCQERLTDQLAHAIDEAIAPRGVGVKVEAEHFCKAVRGIEKKAALVTTSTFLGELRTDRNRRLEFLKALHGEPRDETTAERLRRVLAEPPEPVPRGTYPRRVGPPPSRYRR